MKKNLKILIESALTIFVAMVMISIIIVCIATPDIPKIPGTNPDLESPTVQYDLLRIESYYNEDFLTYAGQVKGWLLRKLDLAGVTLSDEMKDYYLRYQKFNDCVDAFIVDSDTTMLNMSLSPTEFKTTLELLTEKNK